MQLPFTYFGNIAYFALLAGNKEVELTPNERYQKQTYRTRTKIIAANGIQNLTIPVERPNGKETLTSELLISHAENWPKEHLKSIESAYRNSPYFIYYFDEIEKILLSKTASYIELASKTINFGIEKVGLSCDVFMSNAEIDSINTNGLMNPKKESASHFPRYIQTFEERHGFVKNLSILDLLFNEGPNSISILQEVTG